MKKQLFLLLFVVAAGTGAISAEIYSGSCGANLTWILNTIDSTFVLEGSGAIPYPADGSPWEQYKPYVAYLSLPEELTGIAACAFSNCPNLKQVSIPAKVLNIDKGAFNRCYSLIEISVASENLYYSSIDGVLFDKEATILCQYPGGKEGDYIIPESVESIADYSFAYCYGLTGISIPDAVNSISDDAFCCCTNLARISIAEGNIMYDSRENCNAIIDKKSKTLVFGCKNTIIPNSIYSIGARAFLSCQGLINIVIPDGVTSVELYAFYDCTNLISVDISSTVTSIGEYAFSRCSNLTKINVDKNNTIYDSRDNCNAIINTASNMLILGGINTIIPNNVTIIGSHAFEYLSGLTDIIIPNSVTDIGDFAFCECSGLTSITIPERVTNIRDYAFAGCSALETVNMMPKMPPTWKGYYSQSICEVFKNCTNLSGIYVPCGTLDAYMSSWSTYSDRLKYHTLGYSISGEMNIEEAGNILTPISICEDTIITAVSNYGYNFVQWSDGITDNPRTIVLTQDTTIIAEFAKNEYHICTTSNNLSWGTTAGDGSALYLEEIEISAMAKYGYHFAQWNDGNSSNPRKVIVTKDETYSATFAKNIYSITQKANNAQGYISGLSHAEYLDNVALMAIPNRGYYFVKWADGITDNPRTINLTQDTTLEAIFDYIREGKCGKDNVLAWAFESKTMALEITGAGALSENYTYGTFIESVTIGNGVTVIGQNAFRECNKLQNIIVGASVKVIEENAFYGCPSIKSITCYSQRPPTVNNGFSGLDYCTIIYVPMDYLNTYKMHGFWGMYDVRPLGATSTETTELKVDPEGTTADIVWPIVVDATSYELVIRDKDGNVVCTLIFNANGQLTQIAFNAPSRNHTQQEQASGFAFTVTGLDEGTSYDLTITAKDSNGNTLDEKNLSFTTKGIAEGIETISDEVIQTKLFRNGILYILRDGEIYNAQGARVE